MKKHLYIFYCLLLVVVFSTSMAHAQLALNGHIHFTNCDSQTFRITANNYDTGMRGETFFGDGASEIDTFYNGGTTSTRSYFNHVYTESGVYTITHVLLLDGVAIDSNIYFDTVNICHMLHIGSYVDNNGDCIYDAGDTYMPNPFTVAVDSAGVPVDTITATSFFYDASGSAPTGTVYTFTLITPPTGYMVACPASGILRDTIDAAVVASSSMFGFVCDTSGFDLDVYGWFSPGISGACSHVYAMNYGCAAHAATVTVNYSPKYAYASVVPASLTATPGVGSVTFDLGSLSPAVATSFIVYFTAVGTPTLGDTTNTTWTVDPITGDINPANNVRTRVDTVRSSFDPNEKSVTPQGYITAGTPLEYKIGFENTGNDTAFNIHVQDTLSDNVDINTFALVSASAHTDVSLSTAGGHNIVKFDFPHINLLDATHPGQSTGMVVYNVSAKTGLPNGTLINNQAGIYFDDNAVVGTNRVVNIIGLPTGIAVMNNTQAAIYPNPVTEILTVKMAAGTYSALSITNTIGQVMLQQQLAASETHVNVKTLPAGMYYITLHGDSGVIVQKFQKL